jgi:hypothetical protein
MSGNNVGAYRDDASSPERSARYTLIFALVSWAALAIPTFLPLVAPPSSALVGFLCFSGFSLWLIMCSFSVVKGIETIQRVNARPLKPRILWMAIAGLILDGMSILAMCQLAFMVLGNPEE